MSTPFDESKVKRDHGKFAPKGYADSGQLDLGSPSLEHVAQHLDQTGYAPQRVELTAAETVDARDIAAECRDLYQTVQDEDADLDDRAEALATLRDRLNAATEIASGDYDESTAADAWEEVAMSSSPTLCRDDKFADYLREDTQELGMVSPEMAPFVDWDRFAQARMADYGQVEVGGDTFFYRA